MAQERQPGFLPRPLAQQACLGIRGAGVRLVAPALPPKVHRRVARIVVQRWRRSLLGPEAPGLAAASIRVPSTLKCSSDSSPSSSAAHTTSSNRVRPASWASSRCRFLVKTVALKLRSIRSMSRNQRQGRLYPVPRRRRARYAPSRGRSGASPRQSLRRLPGQMVAVVGCRRGRHSCGLCDRCGSPECPTLGQSPPARPGSRSRAATAPGADGDPPSVPEPVSAGLFQAQRRLHRGHGRARVQRGPLPGPDRPTE